ncbi:MAG: Ubiquitin conjugation factor E4 B [Paramarteilia canceri]
MSTASQTDSIGNLQLVTRILQKQIFPADLEIISDQQLMKLVFDYYVKQANQTDIHEVLRDVVCSYKRSWEESTKGKDVSFIVEILSQFLVLAMAGYFSNEKLLFRIIEILEKNLDLNLISKLYENITFYSEKCNLKSELLNAFANEICELNIVTKEFEVCYSTILKHVNEFLGSKNKFGVMNTQDFFRLDNLSYKTLDDEKSTNYLAHTFFTNLMIPVDYDFDNDKLKVNSSLYLPFMLKEDDDGENFLIMQKYLHSIGLKFLSKELRNDFLDYLLIILETYKDRAKLIKSFSFENDGDNLLLNITYFCNTFCEKIKVEMVDLNYLLNKKYISSTKLHKRLNKNAEEIQEISSDKDDFNFSTKMFFIAAGFQNISIIPMINRKIQLNRALSELEPIFMRADELYSQTVNMMAHLDPAINDFVRRYKSLKTEYQCTKKAIDLINSVLKSKIIQENSINYFRISAQILMTLMESVFPNNESSENSNNQNNIDIWSSVPESMIENMCITLREIEMNNNSLLLDSGIPILFEFLYKFISKTYNNQISNNPHIVDNILDALSHLLYRNNRNYISFVMSQSENYDFIKAIIKLYNNTGMEDGSNENQDKFTVRYNISSYIAGLKRIPNYEWLSKMSSVVGKEFRLYINTILSDLSYTLFEAIEMLKQIHYFQQKTSSSHNLNMQQEEAQQFSRNEQNIKSLLMLTETNMESLKDLTLNEKEHFLTDEILIRFVPVISSNIKNLCGPDTAKLIVKNKKKYHWNPKKILDLTIDIILNMNGRKFCKEIALDGLTDFQAYDKALILMQTRLLRAAQEVEAFRDLIILIKRISENAKTREDLLKDAPEKYLDPLTYSLMKDPVKLPTGTIMDKTVIVQHLLNSQSDPFTRMPLSEEELVPDLKLKEEIEEWIKKKRSTNY